MLPMPHTFENTLVKSRQWVIELAGSTPEDGYGGFSYARSPAGILFEPERESKELFERWYAGGTLY